MALDLKGIIPATILPMTAEGEIDESELRKYIRWIAAQGIRAVAVNVDTGEGPHLWHEEKLRVLRIYKEELAGTKIQIVAGLGASFTAQAVKYGMDYREAGADTLLIFPISAYLGHPLPSEIPYQYHRAIADKVGLPMILFTLQPSLGGTDFTNDTLARLLEIPQVEAIKEALFDAKRFREIAALVRGRIPAGYDSNRQRQLHLGVVPSGCRWRASRGLRDLHTDPRASSRGRSKRRLEDGP